MIVGSGGGGGDLEDGECSYCEEREPGEASFLCVRSRLVRDCWRAETRAKGV